MKQQMTIRPGNMTLMTVFMTAMISFLLLLSDNVRAVNDKMAAQADVTTEQAFYASQTCLDEAYLFLRDTAPTVQTTISDVGVGDATCSVEIFPDPHHRNNGTIVSTGTSQSTIRTVTSAYTEAGPTNTGRTSSIFHIIDRSGSMKDDSACSDRRYSSRSNCERHGGTWHVEPYESAKLAAVSFLSFLNPAYDEIGVVSYSTDVKTDIGLTGSDYAPVAAAIQNIDQPSSGTNIGDAVQEATNHLLVSSGYTKVEILLTDGKPSVPCADGTERELCAKNRAKVARDNGILLITIGLGNGVDPVLLDTMASKRVNGSPLSFYAPNSAKLKDIYKEIAAYLTSYNIGQGSWNEL